MIYPAAVYRPVSNHGGPMSAHLGLVLHVQDGNNSLYNYFNTSSSQVSSHFWAAKSGLVEQYIDTDLRSWAQENGNPTYLSVETEGYPNEPLNASQLTSVAALLSWCATTYTFPIIGPVPHGRQGFTPHCNPDGTPDPSWGNHPCPDPIRLGQMSTIIALTKTPTPPLIVQEDEKMPYYVTNTQGTGFVIPYDLSSKTGIVSGADAGALIATNLYKVLKLSDAQINAIPNAHN